MTVLHCPAGHEVLTGCLWPAADTLAWRLVHARCRPPATAAERHRTITFSSPEEAREAERAIRATHVVGRVGAVLFARPRGM